MQKTILILALIGASAVSAVEVDGIAAKVGADTILKSDVFLEMRRLNAPPEAYVQIRNQMIDRKLIVKAAGEAKMTMQDWVVESRIREIIKRSFDGDRNKLLDMLSKQKISYPEWHARMKDDMIVSAMRWNVVDKNVNASPAAMMAEFKAHPEKYAVGRKTTVAVILLKPEDAPKRNEIDGAIATTDFGELAKKFSVDSHASEGGLWKDVNPADVFKPEVCAEIEKMPKGTISHWIEIDGWSFLLRKVSDDPGRNVTFDEAYDKVEENVKEEEARKMYEAWIGRLRADTYIKVF